MEENITCLSSDELDVVIFDDEEDTSLNKKIIKEIYEEIIKCNSFINKFGKNKAIMLCKIIGILDMFLYYYEKFSEDDVITLNTNINRVDYAIHKIAYYNDYAEYCEPYY